jgi:hypothetical protein
MLRMVPLPRKDAGEDEWVGVGFTDMNVDGS